MTCSARPCDQVSAARTCDWERCNRDKHRVPECEQEVGTQSHGADHPQVAQPSAPLTAFGVLSFVSGQRCCGHGSHFFQSLRHATDRSFLLVHSVTLRTTTDNLSHQVRALVSSVLESVRSVLHHPTGGVNENVTDLSVPLDTPDSSKLRMPARGDRL